MPDLLAINWLAVAAATVAGMLLGAAWYSPLLFGNAWLAALNKRPEELGPAAPAMLGSLVATLVSALGTALIVAAFDVDSATGGAAIGLLLGLSLVAMAMLSDSLFCGWGWRLFLIQAGFRVSYLVVMGAILGGWRA